MNYRWPETCFDLAMPTTDAIALLKADHKKVKGLFKDFENAEGKRAKKKES